MEAETPGPEEIEKGEEDDDGGQNEVHGALIDPLEDHEPQGDPGQGRQDEIEAAAHPEMAPFPDEEEGRQGRADEGHERRCGAERQEEGEERHADQGVAEAEGRADEGGQADDGDRAEDRSRVHRPLFYQNGGGGTLDRGGEWN